MNSIGKKSHNPIIRNRAWRPAIQRLNETLARNKRNQAGSALALEEQLTRVRTDLFGFAPK
jgi:hypothetical protein